MLKGTKLTFVFLQKGSGASVIFLDIDLFDIFFRGVVVVAGCSPKPLF